jgi:hypothetical protein
VLEGTGLAVSPLGEQHRDVAVRGLHWNSEDEGGCFC